MSKTRILLFDGVCNLCNGAVQFIVRRDPHARFQFASIQSPAAAPLLRKFNISEEDAMKSFVLIEDDQVYRASTAALRIAQQLTFPWWLGTIGWIVPEFLRDAVYYMVARNRYNMFGKKDVCMMPSKELKARFLS